MIIFNQDCVFRLGQEMTTAGYADHVIPDWASKMSVEKRWIEKWVWGAAYIPAFGDVSEGAETINSVDDKVFHVLGSTADILYQRK